MAKKTYDWTCVKCGTLLKLNQRVSQRKRHCPHCGTEITARAMDRQRLATWVFKVFTGCFSVVGLVLGLFAWLVTGNFWTGFWLFLGVLVLGALAINLALWLLNRF
jgi:putative FmdB family regulatory protein